MECTDRIIGISENECDCYSDGLNGVTPEDPDWYKVSASGLYLDELESEGLISMRAANNTMQCDKTIGTFYREAVAQAIKRTRDDVFLVISERFINKQESFSGRIGGNKFDRGLAINGAVIAGVLLTPRPIIDGVFKLTGINMGSTVNRTGLVISIYQRFVHRTDQDPVLIANITDVTTVMNRITTKTLLEPIILPLAVEKDAVEYEFIYNMADGETLPNTTPSCGCGRKEHLFNTYATFQGITLDADATSLDDFRKTTGSTYGISLEGEFTCDSQSIVCRMFDSSPAWRKVFAYAVRYLAAAIVNEKILNSPDISRWNMVNYEDSKANANNFRGEYSSRITWLAQNTDPSVNDCYKCNSGLIMRKQGILS